MKVTGSNITITDSVVNKMQILPLGNCEQDGTPAPDTPQPIKIVTGDNSIVVSNSDNTQSQSCILHLGELELCKIGDYQDVITGSKDNWKVVRNIGSKIIENDVSVFGLNLILDVPKAEFNKSYLNGARSTWGDNGLCDSFKEVDGNISNQNNAFTFRRSKNQVTFFSNAITDLTTAKNLLVGTKWYYQLATPTEETITDTTLINDLNNLYDLMSYNGTTNFTITSDSNNAQMIAEVTYTSESDMNEKLTNIFNSIKSKLYHIIRAL